MGVSSQRMLPKHDLSPEKIKAARDRPDRHEAVNKELDDFLRNDAHDIMQPRVTNNSNERPRITE